MTFAPPKHYQTSSTHTYIIALSSKHTNHEIINHQFHQELQKLKSPTYMYCRATNTNISVVVETLAVSADRPERSSLNCMLGHNGITSRRWRFSAYVDPSITKSCFNCAIKRLELLYENAEISNSNCMVCCDWNFNHVKMAMKKPADYPTEQHPDSPLPPTGREVQNIDYLYPIELSYDIMKAGVQFCFFQLLSQNVDKDISVELSEIFMYQ